MPTWYAVLRAAKYLGVPPWELAAREPLWLNLALAAESAEAQAQETRAKHAQRRKKRP